MSLLHLWAVVAGAAALGLPLLVHWLSRPRPRRLALSTLRFVREAVQQKRARHRLRDLIILSLRVLAVALLAWAFARPLIGAKPLVSTTADGDAVRVVIVDQSQSMAAINNGIAAFERARPVAARYLDYQAGLRADLILAGAKAHATFEQPSGNFAALRDDLAGAKVHSEALDVQGAINSAAEMLAKAGGGQDQHRRRELVIVSDFQRSNWVTADFSALPQDVLIDLESVAPAQTPVNVAILRVGMQGRVEQGRTARLEVDIGNYSSASRDVQVDVTVGGASYRLSGVCPAGSKTTLGTEIALPAAGWQMGEARLVGMDDAMKADDVRPLVVNIRPAPVYALLTREPTRPRADSSHYLERAIAPFDKVAGADGAASGERVVRMDPLDLDRDTINSADLVVLDHPGSLSAEQTNLLAGLLRRGRAVLYVACEPVDATNLRLLAEAAGSDMKMPVEFAPLATGQVRSKLFWAEVRRELPPFNIFGDSLGAATGSLRFGGGLLSRPLPAGLADDVRATYSDRTAGLIITSCGAGMLAVLNADLAASDLPKSPLFVPMIGELVGSLLAQRRTDASAACGEPVATYLPVEAGAAAALHVEPPSPANGGADLGALAEDNGLVIWRWSAAGPPAVYQVKRDQNTVFALATAIPPAESDLQALDGTIIKQRLAGGRAVSFRSASGDEQGQQRDDVWAWVLVACAACMLAEWAALRLFRT